MFCKKGVPKNFGKFSGKHLCRSQKSLVQVFFREFWGIFKIIYLEEHLWTHTCMKWSKGKILSHKYVHRKTLVMVPGVPVSAMTSLKWVKIDFCTCLYSLLKDFCLNWSCLFVIFVQDIFFSLAELGLTIWLRQTVWSLDVQFIIHFTNR